MILQLKVERSEVRQSPLFYPTPKPYIKPRLRQTACRKCIFNKAFGYLANPAHAALKSRPSR